MRGLRGSCVFLLLGASLSAEVVLRDSFSYPDGLIVGATNSPWLQHEGTAGQADISDGQLQITSAESEDVSALLSRQPYDLTNNPSVSALYSSFKVKFTTLPSRIGSYFAHFRDMSVGYRCRVYALTNGVAEAGKFRLGIASTNAFSTTPGFTSWTSDLSTGVTYTVVTRFSLADGTSTLWINPLSEGDPGISSTGTNASISSYAFRQGPGIGTILIDDLLVGTSFDSVLPIRLAITVVGNEIEISWPAAPGYRLEAGTGLSSENWHTVPETPSTVGNRRILRYSNPMGTRFFRLVKP